MSEAPVQGLRLGWSILDEPRGDEPTSHTSRSTPPTKLMYSLVKISRPWIQTGFRVHSLTDVDDKESNNTLVPPPEVSSP